MNYSFVSSKWHQKHKSFYSKAINVNKLEGHSIFKWFSFSKVHLQVPFSLEENNSVMRSERTKNFTVDEKMSRIAPASYCVNDIYDKELQMQISWQSIKHTLSTAFHAGWATADIRTRWITLIKREGGAEDCYHFHMRWKEDWGNHESVYKLRSK